VNILMRSGALTVAIIQPRVRLQSQQASGPSTPKLAPPTKSKTEHLYVRACCLHLAALTIVFAELGDDAAAR
jgi:hypothetical protein